MLLVMDYELQRHRRRFVTLTDVDPRCRLLDVGKEMGKTGMIRNHVQASKKLLHSEGHATYHSTRLAGSNVAVLFDAKGADDYQTIVLTQLVPRVTHPKPTGSHHCCLVLTRE